MPLWKGTEIEGSPIRLDSRLQFQRVAPATFPAFHEGAVERHEAVVGEVNGRFDRPYEAVPSDDIAGEAGSQSAGKARGSEAGEVVNDVWLEMRDLRQPDFVEVSRGKAVLAGPGVLKAFVVPDGKKTLSSGRSEGGISR